MPVLLAAGCLQTNEPTDACGGLELDRQPGGFPLTSAAAPVVAVSARSTKGDSFVVYNHCDTTTDRCELRRAPLPALSPGSQILIAGSGRWIAGIDRTTGSFHAWRVQGDGLERVDLAPDPPPYRLIAGLRHGDRILVRDAHANLYAFTPGSFSARYLGGESQFVTAVGRDHVVLREILDNRTDRLMLVHAGPVPGGSDPQRAEVTVLGQFHQPARVVFAPDDSTVAVTVGANERAETLVFATSDGMLVDRFMGRLISGRTARPELPGISAYAPGNIHLAYRTPSGALAVRDVSRQGGCLARSSTVADHQIAGFTAWGLLLAEGIQGEHDVYRDRSQIVAMDFERDVVTELGDGSTMHLAAAPARPTETPLAWGLGVREGRYHLVTEDGRGLPLSFDEVELLPRDAAGLWLLDSRLVEPSLHERTLTLERILPRSTDGGIVFEHGEGTRPHWFDDEGTQPVDMGPVLERFSGGQQLCLSTGAPGSWAYRCAAADERGFFRGTAKPSSERPGERPPEPEPELPPTERREATETAQATWAPQPTATRK